MASTVKSKRTAAPPPPDDAIASVRGFTRFYTNRLGVLQEALLGSNFSLPEGRLVFEIAHAERPTASDLAAGLNLDAGYVSRLLKSLEARKFLTRTTSETDGRRSILAVTAKGRNEFAKINARSDAEVARLLEPLSASERIELRNALATVQRLLSPLPAAPEVTLRSLRTGDVGLVVSRQAVLYAQEFGWDGTFESMVAKVGGEYIERYDPKSDAAWIAEIDGRMAGSVFLVRKSRNVAKLRLLYVEPGARGHGIGRRLVETCMQHARTLGYKRMTLWTNDVLTAARAIYVKAGFELTESEPHHSFGKDLVGETWERDL